jgi:hypothetical protein
MPPVSAGRLKKAMYACWISTAVKAMEKSPFMEKKLQFVPLRHMPSGAEWILLETFQPTM